MTLENSVLKGVKTHDSVITRSKRIRRLSEYADPDGLKMIIKGDYGTGKTSLALTFGRILNEIDGKYKNCIGEGKIISSGLPIYYFHTQPYTFQSDRFKDLLDQIYSVPLYTDTSTGKATIDNYASNMSRMNVTKSTQMERDILNNLFHELLDLESGEYLKEGTLILDDSSDVFGALRAVNTYDYQEKNPTVSQKTGVEYIAGQVWHRSSSPFLGFTSWLLKLNMNVVLIVRQTKDFNERREIIGMKDISHKEDVDFAFPVIITTSIEEGSQFRGKSSPGNKFVAKLTKVRWGAEMLQNTKIFDPSISKILNAILPHAVPEQYLIESSDSVL